MRSAWSIATVIAGAIPCAAAAGPLEPLNHSQWIMPTDYPEESIEAGESGAVSYRLDVGPQGDVQKCTIVKSSGFERLDSLTCSLLLKRARFHAATDKQGDGIPSWYLDVVRWLSPYVGNPYSLLQRDSTITFDTDESGFIKKCSVDRAVEPDEKQFCKIYDKVGVPRDKPFGPEHVTVRTIVSVTPLP